MRVATAHGSRNQVRIRAVRTLGASSPVGYDHSPCAGVPHSSGRTGPDRGPGRRMPSSASRARPRPRARPDPRFPTHRPRDRRSGIPGPPPVPFASEVPRGSLDASRRRGRRRARVRGRAPRGRDPFGLVVHPERPAAAGRRRGAGRRAARRRLTRPRPALRPRSAVLEPRHAPRDDPTAARGAVSTLRRPSRRRLHVPPRLDAPGVERRSAPR